MSPPWQTPQSARSSPRRGKWREHARDLGEPLHFAEIADPDDDGD
jgi:hypothetical protein